MASEKRRTETLVGLFLFLGFLMLGGLVVQFANIAQWVKGRYPVTVEFGEATGVIKGSTVRMLGAKIGEVSEKPELTKDARVIVELAIEEKFEIPEGSMFQIASASLLGDKEIIITPPEEKSPGIIQPGEKLMGGGPSGLELIQSEAEVIASDVRILFKDARTALIKIDSSLDDLRAVAIRLAEGIETVNEDVLSPENVRNLSEAIANFNQATKNVSELAGDLRPAAGDARVAIFEVRDAARQAKLAIAKLEPAFADAPEVLEAFKETAASIEKTADTASAAIAQVKKGDGTISALTSDKETKEDTQTFIKNLRKYGILRYRDEETKEDPRERFQGRRR